MADFNNPPLIRHAEGSWHYKDFLRVCKSMQSCQLSINHYFKKNHRSVINRCSQPLLSPLDQYFIPWPRKNIAQCMDPCSCSYILFHILLFPTGRYMKTICLKSLLVFYLFLCKINRTLLDFVVSKVSTLLVPQLIFVCLYGVLLCLIWIQ